MTRGLGAAVEALLAARAARGRIVDLGGDHGDALATVPCSPMREKELVEALRRGRGPDVVVVERPSATLRRTLREHAPGLLLVTGALPADEIAALDDIAAHTPMRWLGPRAVLRSGGGEAIAVAHGAGELAGLLRALGPEHVRLALCPTPRWLPQLCEHERLRGLPVVGTVDARVLDVAWVTRARSDAARHDVLVPVGVPRPALDRPRAPELEAAVAAHALERWTGPVFPSPRVLATLLQRRTHAAAKPRGDAVDPDAVAVWDQARRALPMTGAAVGMQAPDPSLPLQAPTAAFLAQRALLREASLQQLLARAPSSPPAPAAEGLARAAEVLERSAEELTDQESKVVLRGLGLQVTRQAVASSPSGAAGFAERIGFPVVLKALSPTLRRRTEIGAIELDLGNAAAVRRAYATIVDNVERRAPTARLDGVVVAEHVPEGLDVQVGALRLPGEGHAVFACAHAGQIALEPVFALAPMAHEDALALAHAAIAAIPVPALRRGSDPDPLVLAEVLLRLSWLLEHFGERLLRIELNPVRLCSDERRYVILDAQIRQRAHVEGR
ncbi:MAG: acetate--CoA ligase family protein [Nannocystaceae bacterium]